MSPAHERLLRYFNYAHLPEHLQTISEPLCIVAVKMAEACEHAHDPAEVTVGLRKPLEAKDCFVRSMVE